MGKRLALSLLIIFSLFVISCQEESGTGNLKIILQTSGSKGADKSLNPDDSAGRIVKYSVSGTGPGTKTFSKDSSSKTMTIEGLSNGQWILEATGITNEGNIVATGSKTINFVGSDSSEVIELDSEVGVGTLNLTITWDSTVTEPFVKVSIQKIDSETLTENTYEVKQGDCAFNTVYKNLDAGYYIVKIILYNEDIKIAGMCESVKIVNAITTIGTVSFKANEKNNSESLALSLNTSDNYGVSGSIENTDDNLIIGENYSVDFLLSGNLITSDYIEACWYIDGIEVCSDSELTTRGLSFDFTAQRGNHLINLILLDMQCGTSSSACFRYCGISDETKGTAIPIACIIPSNSQKIKLDSSTRLGVLPSNRIIVLSPDSNTMQLCHVCETGLILETNGTYTGSMEDFSFIPDTELFASDALMSHFAITDNTKNITILKYNQKKDSIAVALRAANDSKARFTGNYPVFNTPYNDITDIALYRTENENGTILFSDSSSNNIFSVNTLPEGTTGENLTFKDGYNQRSFLLSAGFGNIFYYNDNKLLQAEFDGKTATTLWGKDTVSINNPYKILCINSEHILLVGKEKIKRIRLTDYLGEYRILDDVNIRTTDATLTPDCRYMYACSSDGKLYSYATDYVGNFKCLDTCQTDGNLKQVVTDGIHVIAVSTDGRLYIFEIAEGE